jgi:hypothetical protein
VTHKFIAAATTAIGAAVTLTDVEQVLRVVAVSLTIIFGISTYLEGRRRRRERKDD